MKFIDELDVERVNQTLNFETSECKIMGGCDIFTTKAVASDKKLYKTIDNHLNELLQENESYNNVLQQRKNSVVDITIESDDNNENVTSGSNHFETSNSNTDSQMSPDSEKNLNKYNIDSFWEQKRRLSVNEKDDQSKSPFFVRSNKLNDQNLKELVSENDYVSSSSIDSNNVIKHSRHTSHSSASSTFSNSNGKVEGPLSGGNISYKAGNSNPTGTNNSGTDSSIHHNGNNNNKFKVSKQNSNRRRSSMQDSPSINIGPFGPINETASRRIFAHLIAILNASYPDHDFSSLEPSDFVKSSLKLLVSKVENSLYSLGKKPDESMWEIINSHMDLSDCVIYQYDPTKSFLDDEPGFLWSLNWFIFSKKRKRVAYLYLTCLRLQNNFNEINKEGIPVIARRKLTIDHESNNFEGEYDLAYDENAIDDDSDMDVSVN